jgi:hypothetical protein
MGRRQGIIFALVGVSVALSWFFATREPRLKASHQECLTDVDCVRGERCTVFPKDDGLVTTGFCAEPCVDASTCLNGWKCLAFAPGDGVLLPVGTKGTSGAPVSVCVAGTRAAGTVPDDGGARR